MMHNYDLQYKLCLLQSSSGADLAMLMINAMETSNIPVNTDNIGKAPYSAYIFIFLEHVISGKSYLLNNTPICLLH